MDNGFPILNLRVNIPLKEDVKSICFPYDIKFIEKYKLKIEDFIFVDYPKDFIDFLFIDFLKKEVNKSKKAVNT